MTEINFINVFFALLWKYEIHKILINGFISGTVAYFVNKFFIKKYLDKYMKKIIKKKNQK